MKNNKGFMGMGLILAIIAVLIIGGGAYYVGKNSNTTSQNTNVNNPQQENQNTVTNTPVQNTFTIKNSNTKSTQNLISFSGCGGNFKANSSDLTSVKIYVNSTGTEITSATLFGSMNLISTSNGIQAWSMPAGSLLATDIYAVGYNGSIMTNQKDYPFTGASTIYEHLFGTCL